MIACATVTAALKRPVFADLRREMEDTVTFGNKRAGIDPRPNEHSADGICTTFGKLHVGDWPASTIAVACYLDYRSFGQLFDQLCNLRQKGPAGRDGRRAISWEINDWELGSRHFFKASLSCSGGKRPPRHCYRRLRRGGFALGRDLKGLSDVMIARSNEISKKRTKNN